MSNISKVVGERLRARRKNLGYSQEQIAEFAGLHPTYIGQLERGEKNATLESIEKICSALNYPMSQLFENIIIGGNIELIADQCYSLIVTQSPKEQRALLKILEELIQYKKTTD